MLPRRNLWRGRRGIWRGARPSLVERGDPHRRKDRRDEWQPRRHGSLGAIADRAICPRWRCLARLPWPPALREGVGHQNALVTCGEHGRFFPHGVVGGVGESGAATTVGAAVRAGIAGIGPLECGSTAAAATGAGPAQLFCSARVARYSWRLCSAASSVLAAPWKSIANHNRQMNRPATPAATFCATLAPSSEPSGPIETLGSQAFRESAHPTNKLVVRFSQRMGTIHWHRTTSRGRSHCSPTPLLGSPCSPNSGPAAEPPRPVAALARRSPPMPRPQSSKFSFPQFGPSFFRVGPPKKDRRPARALSCRRRVAGCSGFGDPH